MTTAAAASRHSVDDPDSTFFIVGCQRSGTTLMRLILECHSQVQCCDEATSYPLLARRRPAPARERPLLGLKIPCLGEQLARPFLWDWILVPEVPNVYRGHRIVFMVRDVRDTIDSMRALTSGGGSWAETHMLPTLHAKISRDAAFRRRYAEQLAELERARHPTAAKAAFYWRYKTDALFDYLERRFPVLPVRYEDLVSQPSLELLRICAFLRIGWEPGLLRHEGFAHGEVDSDGRAVGATDARRPIDVRSVNRGHGAFDGEEHAEILRFAGAAQALIYPSVMA